MLMRVGFASCICEATFCAVMLTTLNGTAAVSCTWYLIGFPAESTSGSPLNTVQLAGPGGNVPSGLAYGGDTVCVPIVVFMPLVFTSVNEKFVWLNWACAPFATSLQTLIVPSWAPLLKRTSVSPPAPKNPTEMVAVLPVSDTSRLSPVGPLAVTPVRAKPVTGRSVIV